MTLKHILLTAVPAGCLLLSGMVATPGPYSIVSAAQADTNVSVNFSIGTFYDQLQPYGSWVSMENEYVFVPQNVDASWRPYTVGHWAYTKRYGWYWVSSEPFGWATYHYGRWGYSRDLGWYWVPGRRWAPAWVAWSRGHDRIAWAPLPPRHGGGDVDVSITIGDVPDYYWQAVPVSAFLSIDLSNEVIRDRDQVRTVVHEGRPETVRVENNIVINNVIQVNEIEQATQQKVKVLDAKPVTSPDAAGKTDANSVGVFNPEVKADTNAKPPKPVDAQQVASERKAKGIQPQDVPADQSAAPAQNGNGTTQPVPADSKTAVPATPDKKASEPTKPADTTAPKVDSQGKVDSTQGKDATPAPAPGVKAPDAKAPMPATPDKGKQDKTVEPQSNTGSGATAPAEPPKSNDVKQPQPPKDAQPPKDQKQAQPLPKAAEPPKDAQQPKDQQKANEQKSAEPNAGKQMKKDEPGKAKCDPAVETCPAQ